MDIPMTEVEIAVACKNLQDRDTFSKSDPLCVLYLKDSSGGNFREIGRTEQIKNSLNPEFMRKFRVNYFFEEAQRLKFELYDIDSNSAQLSSHDFLGRVELTLGEVFGSPGAKVHRPLSGLRGNCGSIIISADEVSTCREALLLQLQANKLDKSWLSTPKPFFAIYRINDDQSRSLITRSEQGRGANPVWKEIKLGVGQLCRGDYDRPIHLEVFDYAKNGSHRLIGNCELSLNRLVQNKTGIFFDIINSRKKAKSSSYKNSGQLLLAKCEIRTEYTFLDYITHGTQIHFSVAVDFTASNGNPTDPRSHHYIHPQQPNQYIMALKAVGEICQDYDSTKMFPSLGFGAKVPPDGRVSHEFFLNFDPHNPYCYGVEGILDAYRRAIVAVTLFGPTNFAPVINHVARIAASTQDGSHYYVLLIITDGIISDMEKTKAAIVQASSLPMSIIIVGVGQEDFAAMEVLDADNQRLFGGGRYADRDIVQFVPFRDFQAATGGANWASTQALLAKEVLAEVPTQLTSWMQSRGIRPDNLPKPNVSHASAPSAPPSAPQSFGDTVRLPPIGHTPAQPPPYPM